MAAGYLTQKLNARTRADIRVFHSEGAPELPRQFLDFLDAADQRREELQIIEIDDAILEFGRFTKCLYDREGQRVAASAIVRAEGASPRVWNAVERLESLDVSATISTPILFQSAIVNHWGHFLLETLSRTWATRERPDLAAGGALFPMNACRNLAEAAGANMGQVLALNGFEQFHIDPPPLRVRLAKCWVPTPSFVVGPGGRADVRHLEAPRRVSERLMSVRRKDSRPIYLSRSRVPEGGVRRDVANESELEARLETSGVRVIHMQELTLAEQVEIVNAHSVFIGPWGSALHNTMFCLPDHAITTFVLIESFAPSDILLVNAILGNAAHYLEVMSPPIGGGKGRRLNIDIDATIDYLRDYGVI